MPTPDEIIAEGQRWLRNEYGMFDPGIKEFGDHMRKWFQAHECSACGKLIGPSPSCRCREGYWKPVRLDSSETVADANDSSSKT